MELTSRTWYCVTVLIMLSSLLKSARGGRVRCWSCSIEIDSETCRTVGERYIPEVAVTDDFCDDLRAVPELVKQLCTEFPKGYKVVCDRLAPIKVEICSSDYCPVEGKSSRQRGNSAISHHAADMVFIMAATSFVSVVRMLL